MDIRRIGARLDALVDALERRRMEQTLPVDPLSASLMEFYEQVSEDDLQQLAATLCSDT